MAPLGFRMYMELYTGQNLVVKFVVKTSSYLTKLSFAMIFEMPVLCCFCPIKNKYLFDKTHVCDNILNPSFILFLSNDNLADRLILN